MTEPIDQLFEDPAFARIIRGINDAVMGSEVVPVCSRPLARSNRAGCCASAQPGGGWAHPHLTVSGASDAGELAELGIEVPARTRVLGFDDHNQAAATTPPHDGGTTTR